MTTVPAERLAKIFVEIADTLIDEFDLIEFLQMIADRAALLLDASAVGILLADSHGNLQFMAASNETARLLELFQVQTSEGPCLEAYSTAAPVINVDLAGARSRWPRFSAEAVACGYTAVHAFPLRLRAEVIGAMNVFGDGAAAFDEADAQVMQALADIAAIALLQERAISRGELLTEQLQAALNSRVIIEQAKGALAQRHVISVDDAFELIRAYARRTNRRLVEVAYAVVTDLGSLPALDDLGGDGTAR